MRLKGSGTRLSMVSKKSITNPNKYRLSFIKVARYPVGVICEHGRLEGDVLVDLWSITQSGNDSEGMPGEMPAGSNAYPDMTTRAVTVGNREIPTDGEGYLVDPSDWSEGFARAEAALECLDLKLGHWEVIRTLREHYAKHGTQISVRDMVRHFRKVGGAGRLVPRINRHRRLTASPHLKRDTRLRAFAIGARTRVDWHRLPSVQKVPENTPARSR